MPFHRGLQALAIALGLVLPVAALAQKDVEEKTLPFKEENYILLGAAPRSRPAYDGSASQRVDAVPIVRYYGKPWFVRTTQGIFEGGARMEVVPGLVYGVQLAYEAGRKASESDFLREHNIEDLNVGASLGMHLEWDGKLGPAPVNALVRYRQNAEQDRSDQVDLRFNAGLYGSGRATLGVFAQTTWASEKSVNTLYGIKEEQSATTGLPPFRAQSGLMNASFGLWGTFDISRRWVVVWSAHNQRLLGDAKNSPLAERTSNYYANAGVAYRF